MRYTTSLLAPTVRLTHSRRNRILLAIVTIGLALFAGGLWIGTRPAVAPVQPRLGGFIIITATAAPTATPAPTPTTAPTAEPVIVTILVERTVFVEVEHAQPEPEAAPTAAPEGVPVMLENESLANYAGRIAADQHQFGRP